MRFIVVLLCRVVVCFILFCVVLVCFVGSCWVVLCWLMVWYVLCASLHRVVVWCYADIHWMHVFVAYHIMAWRGVCCVVLHVCCMVIVCIRVCGRVVVCVVMLHCDRVCFVVVWGVSL